MKPKPAMGCGASFTPRRHDGQLDDSGLGTGEIELVVRAFVKVWRRMRHRRIPYPIPARKAFSA